MSLSYHGSFSSFLRGPYFKDIKCTKIVKKIRFKYKKFIYEKNASIERNVSG